MVDPRTIRRFPSVFLNHDTYERHYWTVRLLGRTRPGETVIDVGGERNLEMFAGRLKVRNVNVVGPDAVEGGAASLPDKSFDYAVSIDTLEHIPKAERGQHLAHLVRLARRRVVFCAPIGQPAQVRLQHALLDAGILDEASVRYLREHLEYGMPTPEEIQEVLPDRLIRWRYSGNVNVYAPPRIPRSRIGRVILPVAAFLVNWLLNLTWLHFKVGARRRAVTNRLYGVIDLDEAAPAGRSEN